MKTNVISAFLQATDPEKAPTAIPDGQFAELVTEFLPEGVHLPDPLVRTFNWIEAQGWYEVKDDGENPDDYSLHIYSGADRSADRDLSWVLFGPETFALTEGWDTPLPEMDERVTVIASTSPDGGRAAIWRDDQDKQWFVHIGHDSAGVISDDPLVFLQFLAMGYIEPGGLKSAEWTAPQEALEYHGFLNASDYSLEGEETQPPLLPQKFRKFLEREFNITIPHSASALGISTFSDYADLTTTDPFARWLISITPVAVSEKVMVDEPMNGLSEDSVQSVYKPTRINTSGTQAKPTGLLAKIKSLIGGNT